MFFQPSNFGDDVLPEVSFDYFEVITCTSSALDYYNPVYDIRLRIPEQAIPDGDLLEIEFGVVHYGQFCYPKDLKIVSPVIWLCAKQTDFTAFNKPIEVSLPHFYDCSSESDLQKLSFLKGNHMAHSYQESERSGYKLITPSDGNSTFTLHESYGTYSTNHFCYLCIGAEYTEEFTSKSKFCLISGVPQNINKPTTWSVCYCLTYKLKNCIMVSIKGTGKSCNACSVTIASLGRDGVQMRNLLLSQKFGRFA